MSAEQGLAETWLSEMLLVASEGGCLLHAHCKGPEEI